MEYLDERIIGLPNCSKDNLRKQISDLEIKNFGHTTSSVVTPSSLCVKRKGYKKVYSGKMGLFIRAANSCSFLL